MCDGHGVRRLWHSPGTVASASAALTLAAIAPAALTLATAAQLASLSVPACLSATSAGCRVTRDLDLYLRRGVRRLWHAQRMHLFVRSRHDAGAHEHVAAHR